MKAKAKSTRARPKRKTRKTRPAASARLSTYDEKRDFGVTSEPRGERAPRARRARRDLAYVVQKHDATRLHYDFRLEHEGALWSWAVPKGPSLDPAVRHLAARTEDHPLDYASFEGTIPEGEYGGGPVLVWDRGTWEPEGDAAAGMKKGHLRFTLHGEKLTGAFHLVRLAPKEGPKESWLLFKSKDDAARPGSDIVAERPESVLSARTIDDVRAGRRRPQRPRGNASPKKSSRAEPKKRAASGSDLTTALRALALGFEVTSPEKILDDATGLTKAELMGYLAWIAPRMLPYVAGRPLMLLRCPEGRGGACFFQKHPGTGVPSVVRRVGIREKTARGDSLVIDDRPGLVALGQMGVLEIHTWMARADRIEAPDQMVLDVDPDEGLPFDRVIDAALALREVLREIGLVSFVKTTGGKGLHVVAPLATGPSWEEHEGAALAVVRYVARSAPDRYVTVMSKAARRGRIFLDYLRNGRGATAVAPYSPRAREGIPIAMPISWTALEKRTVDPRAFTLRRVALGRLPADPWRAYASTSQALDLRAVQRLSKR